jgi:hypothetical protein
MNEEEPVYRAERRSSGTTVFVSRESQEWPLRDHGGVGFDWSNSSPQAAGLAVSILMDFTGGDHTLSLAAYKQFTLTVVSRIEFDGFQIKPHQIRGWWANRLLLGGAL